MKFGFGWFQPNKKNAGVAYHAARCQNCGASVIMSEKYRNSSQDFGTILDKLDIQEYCCSYPQYDFVRFKKVYTSKDLAPAPSPVEEWKDITMQVSFSTHKCHLDSILVDVKDGERLITCIGVDGMEAVMDGYRIDKDVQTATGTSWFKVFRKVS